MGQKPPSSGSQLPFTTFPGLPSEAARRIWRDFEAISLQTPGAGNTFFVACSNAFAWEKSAADLILPGASDEIPLNALLNAHPCCRIILSSGQVNATGTIGPSASTGVSWQGAVSSDPINNFGTQIIFTGAPANYDNNAGNYFLFRGRNNFDDCSIGPANLSGISGVTVCCLSSITSSNGQDGGHMRNCVLTRIDYLFGANSGGAYVTAYYAVENCSTTGFKGVNGWLTKLVTTNANLASCLFLNNDNFNNTIDSTISESLFVGHNFERGFVPPGPGPSGNLFLPGPGTDTTAMHVGDAAGGDLTGTYPSPTIKSSVSLSGSPTTTTQAPGTNNTTIATTAFVLANALRPPFVVVDAAGAGDFTSIAAAIAAQPAGAANVSQLIYVKQSASIYDDSAATVDFAGKNITIVGEESDGKSADQVGATNQAPQWKLNASGLTNSGAGNAIRLINMKINMASGQLCGSAGSGMAIEAEHCELPDLYGTSGTINLIMRWCKFGTLFTNSIAFAPTTVNIESSRGTALNANAALLTWNGSTVCRLRHVVFTTSANGTFAIASGAASTYFVFDKVQCSGSGVLTFSSPRNDTRIQIVNCINFQSVTFAVGSTGGCDIIMAGNTSPSSVVTLTESVGNQNESVYIDGEYGQISLACSAATLNVMLNERGTTGKTALTLSGNNNNATVGIVPGTTTTGVALSGNNNVVIAPNIANCATPSTDSGTGNRIITSSSDGFALGKTDFSHAFLTMGG